MKGAEVDLMLAICCTSEEWKSNMIRIYLATSRFAGGGRGELDDYGPYYTDYSCGRLLQYTGSRFGPSFRPVMGDRLNLEQMFGVDKLEEVYQKKIEPEKIEPEVKLLKVFETVSSSNIEDNLTASITR